MVLEQPHYRASHWSDRLSGELHLRVHDQVEGSQFSSPLTAQQKWEENGANHTG